MVSEKYSIVIIVCHIIIQRFRVPHIADTVPQSLLPFSRPNNAEYRRLFHVPGLMRRNQNATTTSPNQKMNPQRQEKRRVTQSQQSFRRFWAQVQQRWSAKQQLHRRKSPESPPVENGLGGIAAAAGADVVVTIHRTRRFASLSISKGLACFQSSKRSTKIKY